MPALKPGTNVPTAAEDAQITAAAMSDPDAIPLTDQEWEAIKPTIKRGRPRSAVTRTMLSLRVDQDVLDALRASGRGWQTRVSALLREAVEKGML